MYCVLQWIMMRSEKYLCTKMFSPAVCVRCQLLLWSPHALGTRTLLWCGHGCSVNRMQLEHGQYYGLGMDALVTVCPWNTDAIMFGHRCSSHRMLLEHGLYYGLGMDALVTACSCSTNAMTVWTPKSFNHQNIEHLCGH